MVTVVIEDYEHIAMDENVNWMLLTHMLLIFSLNLRASFAHPSLLQEN